MRDVIVLAIILGSVPVCLFYPYFGILMWSWVAYFNPHRFTFGMAYDFPVAQAIAIPTILGLVFNRQFNKGIFQRETVLLLFLWIWYFVTYAHCVMTPELARHALDAKPVLMGISKILLMTFLSILLVTSRDKLRYLLLLTVACFGILAIKGAFFGLRTGAEERVWGPPGSFIEDNNFLALATNMCLPLFFYMAQSEKSKWIKLFLQIAFVSSIFSVILSYSRGGLLGLSVVLGLITLRSRYKFVTAAFCVVVAFLVLSFAPGRWMDRMGNFAHGKIDNSAELRLHAWQFAYVLAKEYPLTGGSFNTFQPDLFEKYTPELGFAGPHSIYFQQLGEHGFVGLGLFLGILGSCWISLSKLRRRARAVREIQWVIPYTYMLQTSQLAYMTSGAFLAAGYFDLFYQLVAAVVLLKIFTNAEIAAALRPQPEKADSETSMDFQPDWEPSPAS
jgi:probable O-glycosylation ligase (exosortase A-associated)